MSARLRAQQAQNAALAMARSKIHAQSDFTKDRSHILKEISAKTFVPERNTKQQLKFAVLATRAAKADDLAERYRRDNKVTFKEQALKALAEIPLPFTVDDDPDFAACGKLARAGAKLGVLASEVSVVDNAVNVVLRHTYLVQHAEAAAVASALPQLYPSTGKGPIDSRGGALGRFTTLAPRLKQLAPDAHVSEAAAILSSAARVGCTDMPLIDSLVATVRNWHTNAPTRDICKAMESLTRLAGAAEDSQGTSSQGPVHDAARTLIEAVSDDLCERVGDERGLAALDGVIILACMGRLREPTNRRLALCASDAILTDIESLTPEQCVEALTALASMAYSHPMLARRLSSRILLAAPHLKATVATGALKATIELPPAVPSDAELQTALLERVAEMDASALPIRDAVSIMGCFERVAIGDISGDSLLRAVAKSLLRSVSTHAVPSTSDRTLVESLRLIWQLKWHRVAVDGSGALAAVARELARRGGLPADNPTLLRHAGDAVEGIMNDHEAANQAALSSALGPLVA